MQDYGRTIASIGLLATTLLGLHFTGCSRSATFETEGSLSANKNQSNLDSESQNRFVVYADHQKNLEELARSIEARGGTVLKTLKRQNALAVLMPKGEPSFSTQAKSESGYLPDGIVTLIGPIEGGEIALESNGKQSIPWGIQRVKAREANEKENGTGEGVTVCIIDTGISRNHPDLAENIVGGKNFAATSEANAIDIEDRLGHGSHVAGIIAAVDNQEGVVGVAPGAKLYIAKVFDDRENAYDSDIAEAILECSAQGAQVINLSLGGPKGTTESPMKKAIEEVIAAGTIVVAAAGNEQTNLQEMIPASYEGVIAVAATTKTNGIAGFSNYGLGSDDLSAPGKGIKSTWKKEGYAKISGTSMAAPHVAGLMALTISSGSLGVKTKILKKSGKSLSISKQGAGLINALETVENIEITESNEEEPL